MGVSISVVAMVTVRGKKRHLLVDVLGLILIIVVHAASIQDRDGALLVFDRYARALFPFLERIFADGAYRGGKLSEAMAGAPWKIEVVRRPEGQNGFQVPPK